MVGGIETGRLLHRRSVQVITLMALLRLTFENLHYVKISFDE